MELHRPEAVRAGAFSRIPCLRCEIAHLSGSAFLYLAREMLEMFRRAGIRNYSIWQAGDTLFGYYECDDLQTALAVQKDAPVSARWRTYMRDVIRMERDPKSGAQPHLEQVFFFGCDTCT